MIREEIKLVNSVIKLLTVFCRSTTNKTPFNIVYDCKNLKELQPRQISRSRDTYVTAASVLRSFIFHYENNKRNKQNPEWTAEPFRSFCIGYFGFVTCKQQSGNGRTGIGIPFLDLLIN